MARERALEVALDLDPEVALEPAEAAWPCGRESLFSSLLPCSSSPTSTPSLEKRNICHTRGTAVKRREDGRFLVTTLTRAFIYIDHIRDTVEPRANGLAFNGILSKTATDFFSLLVL